MAAAALFALMLRVVRIFSRFFSWLALLLGTVLLLGWAAALFPRNSGWTEPDAGIEIMVETNGVHTSLVLPLVTPQKDWRADFPVSDLEMIRSDYTHVSISWGQREVFLNTPTWADLKPSTVWHAAFGSEALLHVAHYVRPAPGDDIRPIILREAEYAQLVVSIEEHVLPANQRARYPGYYDWDVFYETGGDYHLGNTCNEWTGDMLAEAGVKTGWKTLFASGVMRWVDRP